MLIAETYLGSVGIGATSPQLFKANDGQIYVVKLLNNLLGPKVLVNEYIACRFAEYINLCFPPSGIIEISQEVIESSRRLTKAKVVCRPHFASKYIHNAYYVDRWLLARSINKSRMAGVMLFDHMFHNFDRTKNYRNLLVRKEEYGYVLYAIDNSHMFQRGRWNIDMLKSMEKTITVNSRRAYGWLLKYYLTDQDFNFYARKVRQLTDEQLTEIIQSIPVEWLPDNEERQALLKFLSTRRDLANEIAVKLSGLIPDVNRSTNFYKII